MPVLPLLRAKSIHILYIIVLVTLKMLNINQSNLQNSVAIIKTKRQTYYHVHEQILPPYSGIYTALLGTKTSLWGPSFKKFEEEIPFNLIDTPALYRALNNLEKAEAIEAYWDTSESGPAKKWYKITQKGVEKLAELQAGYRKEKARPGFFPGNLRKIVRSKSEISIQLKIRRFSNSVYLFFLAFFFPDNFLFERSKVN